MIAKDHHSSSNSVEDDAGYLSQGYIEHHVSKLDTLAGIAIKYGVEVADVKRANGLATDFQMFAHKTLKIPLGRERSMMLRKHGPRKLSLSPTRSQAASSDVLVVSTQISEDKDKDKKPLSSAMSLLRGYYGLSSPVHHALDKGEGMEMTPYGEEHNEEEPFSPIMRPILVAGSSGITGSKPGEFKKECSKLGFVGYDMETNNVPTFCIGDVGKVKSIENSVRRRSKFDNAYSLYGPPEFEGSGIPFLGIDDSTSGTTGMMVNTLHEPVMDDKCKKVPVLRVIKSLSTSNLQEQTTLAVDPSIPRYGGKADVKSSNLLSLREMTTRSLFEGFPKPAVYRRKTALD